MNQEQLLEEIVSLISTLREYAVNGKTWEKREELLVSINKIRLGCQHVLNSGTFRPEEEAFHKIASSCWRISLLEKSLEEGDELELCQSLENLCIHSQ